jgi:hypothetical protein
MTSDLRYVACIGAPPDVMHIPPADAHITIEAACADAERAAAWFSPGSVHVHDIVQVRIVGAADGRLLGEPVATVRTYTTIAAPDAVTLDVLSAELAELYRVLAAEQGRPEGAPSARWRWTGSAWRVGDLAVTRSGTSAAGTPTPAGLHYAGARRADYPHMRAAMIAADRECP